MFLFKSNGEMVNVEMSEIICISRDKDRKTIFCTHEEGLYPPYTLEQLGQAFEHLGFYQIDKNKLINLNKVEHFNDGVLHIGNLSYQVSRRNEPIIREKIQNLMV